MKTPWRNIKQRYISSAFILLISTMIVKVIGAVYKISLTAYIGATGRGYFSVAYNLCMPIHAVTMGAMPIALSKLVSTYNAKGDLLKIKALKKLPADCFFAIGIAGLAVMLIAAKPYSQLISSSPKSIYTILALAPSVFFSCLSACKRSFAEGYLDMKPTAISQVIEALF
ncbi:MAG: oligosaccharide flippase family protein [Clostridiales bacterium]|nr:oligosaccharide flippase family protein [Clostridiales bacterium]